MHIDQHQNNFDLMACFPGNFFSMNIHTWNGAFPYWSPIGFGLLPIPLAVEKIGVGPADKKGMDMNGNSCHQSAASLDPENT